MQLFALIAKVDSVNTDAKSVVETFLKQQLNAELVQQYLEIFQEYLEKHQKKTKNKEGKQRKKTSVNSVKVLRICTQINEELQQKQKTIVLLRLLEFTFADDYSEQEIEFVTTVADTFNIPEEELRESMAFVISNDQNIPDNWIKPTNIFAWPTVNFCISISFITSAGKDNILNELVI